MATKNQRAVLVATLGSEPQVITLAAQLLQQQQSLNAVIVLHTKPENTPISDALPKLVSAFEQNSAWPPLTTQQLPITDILQPADLEKFSTALFNILKFQIASGNRIHLLLAGGRKPMAMIGVTVAQILFGPDDRVWYLHSDDMLRTARRLVLQHDDEAQLVPITIPQLNLSPPVFTRLFQASDLASANQIITADRDRKRIDFIENELTKAEREVVAQIARNVVTVKEIAAVLHKSPKTITNQLNTIYSKLETAFNLQPDKGTKREFLRQILGEYFNTQTTPSK